MAISDTWYFEHDTNYIIIKNDKKRELFQITCENPIITHYTKNKLYVIESGDKRKMYRIVKEYHYIEYSEADTVYYRKQFPKNIINKLIVILEGKHNVNKVRDYPK